MSEPHPDVPPPVWTESVPTRSWAEPAAPVLEPIAPPPSASTVDTIDAPPPQSHRRDRPLWPWVLAVVLVVAVGGTVLVVSVVREGRPLAPNVPPLAAPQPAQASVGGTPTPTPAANASTGASAAVSSAAVSGGPIAASTGASAGARTPTPKAVPNGRVQLRLAHTGMCVGEGPELFKSTGRTVLGQHPCASAAPPIVIAPITGSTVRIKVDSPTNGLGCATVDYGGTADGLLLAARPCDDARADQKFTLEAVSAGYRLHSVPGGGFCVGVYLASRDPGVQLIQTGCDGGADQVFQV